MRAFGKAIPTELKIFIACNASNINGLHSNFRMIFMF